MKLPWVVCLAAVSLLAGCMDEEPADAMAAPAPEPAPLPGSRVGGATVAAAGTILAPGVVPCGLAPSTEVPWEITSSRLDGLELRATNFAINFSVPLIGPDGINIDSDLYLWDPNGKLVGSAQAFDALDGGHDVLTGRGQHPLGTYTLEVRGCTAINGNWSLEGGADIIVRGSFLDDAVREAAR